MNFPYNAFSEPNQMDPKQILKNMTDDQLLQLVKNNPQLRKEYDKIVKQQLSSTNKTKPLTSAEYLKVANKIDQYLDKQGGVYIQPAPGIVIKSIDTNTNQKVFINIVQHPIVDQPQQKLLVDYENQPGLRIPMSLGKVKEDHDKKGNICKVVDAVMNPKVIDAIKIDPGLLSFIGQILITYLFQKHKLKLQQKFTKLKQLNYKGGSIEFHRVKGKKAPKIEQVSQQNFKISEEQKRQQEILFQSLNSNQNKKLALPNFKIFTSEKKNQQYDSEIKNLEFLLIQFQLPLLIHSRGIHLEVNQQMIYIFVKGMYQIYLKLPMRSDKFKSKFIKKRRTLQITMKKKEEIKIAEQEKIQIKKQTVKIQNDLLYDLV